MLLCFLFIILYRSYRAFLGLKPEGRYRFVRHGGLDFNSFLKSEGFWLSKKIDQRIFSVTICVRKEHKKKALLEASF
jgi:hypothetical protein